MEGQPSAAGSAFRTAPADVDFDFVIQRSKQPSPDA